MTILRPWRTSSCGLQKWRWYERNSLPWNRARIHYEFAKRRSFARWPRPRRGARDVRRRAGSTLGEHVLLEPDVWLTGSGRIHIGDGHASSTSAFRSRLSTRSRSARTACSPTAASSPTATTASTTPTSRSPGRASRPRARPSSATTSGAAPTSSSPAASRSGERCVIGANSVVTTDLPAVQHRGRRTRPRAAHDHLPSSMICTPNTHAGDEDREGDQRPAPPSAKPRAASAARLGVARPCRARRTSTPS